MSARVGYLFLAPGADPAGEWTLRGHRGGRTTFVAVPDPDAAASAAAALVADGAQLLELFAGAGPAVAARVIDAAGGVPVGSVGRQETGPDPADVGVLHLAGEPGERLDDVRPGPDGTRRRVSFLALAAPVDAAAAADDLVRGGARRIELCGGFGPRHAAPVIEAVGSGATVGVVQFGAESLQAAARFAGAAAPAAAGRGAR